MPGIDQRTPAMDEPAEFSLEDALLNAWVDEGSVYLQLETDDDDSPPES